MTTPLHEYLPRRPTRPDIQCTGLDDDGNACRHHATAEIVIHGDPELNQNWFHGFVCDLHMPKYDRTDLVKQERAEAAKLATKKKRRTK